MADLRLAAQTAIYEALNVPAVTGIAPVFQHVPEQQEPPMSIVGDMNATPVGGKDGGLDKIEFEIVSLVRDTGREFLTPLMAAIRARIEGQTLPAQTGVELSAPVFESDDDDLLDDRQTYFGLQRFSLFAQPT